MHTATKTGPDSLKTASKKVINKAAEATGEFIRNKITDKIAKPKPVPDVKLRYFEEEIIPEEKREKILNELRQDYYKMEHYKISKLLNDSTASKCVTIKWIDVNDLSGGQYPSIKKVRFKTPILGSNLCD